MVMDGKGRSHKASGRPDGGQYEGRAGTASDDDLDLGAVDARLAAAMPDMDGATRRRLIAAVRDKAGGPRTTGRQVSAEGRARIDLERDAARTISGLEPPDCAGMGPRGAGRALAAWLDEVKPGWRWDRAALAASRPGVDGDYRDRDPIDPMTAEAIERGELGTADRPGRMVRRLREVIPSDVDAMELARRFIHERSESLRRNYALDPTRCLSEEAYRTGISAHFHPERVFVSTLGLSAHRMRFDNRYLKAVELWRAGHGREPDATTRDRLWDDTLAAYAAEKKAAGVSFGNGLNYSDGRSAHEGRATRMRTGVPFNGRQDFEDMYDAGRRRLREWSANYDDFSSRSDEGDASPAATGLASTRPVTGSELRGAGETERRAYKLALKHGYRGAELDRVAAACGFDETTRAGLEAQWRAERALADAA